MTDLHDCVWYYDTEWFGLYCDICTAKASEHCRSGCNTKDHLSYGDCLQAANVSIDKTSLRP